MQDSYIISLTNLFSWFPQYFFSFSSICSMFYTNVLLSHRKRTTKKNQTNSTSTSFVTTPNWYNFSNTACLYSGGYELSVVNCILCKIFKIFKNLQNSPTFLWIENALPFSRFSSLCGNPGVTNHSDAFQALCRIVRNFRFVQLHFWKSCHW